MNKEAEANTGNKPDTNNKSVPDDVKERRRQKRDKFVKPNPKETPENNSSNNIQAANVIHVPLKDNYDYDAEGYPREVFE